VPGPVQHVLRSVGEMLAGYVRHPMRFPR
jgi:hypothetical protein